MEKIRSTTVVAVKHNGKVVIAADGQATLGNTVAKSNVKKIRKLDEGRVVTGFAGSTADAFTLLERFDEKLKASDFLKSHKDILYLLYLYSIPLLIFLDSCSFLKFKENLKLDYR